MATRRSTAKTVTTKEAVPGEVPTFTRDQELLAYREMLLIAASRRRRGQNVRHGPHRRLLPPLYRPGAVVVGMQMAMKTGDQVITGYRDHGHMLATGMEARGVMAELTGRRGGYSKGKGGSMHMFSIEKQFFGGHGIVGAQVSLGTGSASRTIIATMARFRHLFRRRLRPIRARSMRASTWRSCGSCPSCM